MRAIWSLILLLTVNTLYAQPDLKTRLGAFFASQPATTPGFALSIPKKDSFINLPPWASCSWKKTAS